LGFAEQSSGTPKICFANLIYMVRQHYVVTCKAGEPNLGKEKTTINK